MKKLLLIISFVVLTLMIAVPVMAQGPGDDYEAGRVVLGANLTLKEGDFIDGDVVVFGGNFEMEEGSEVRGDVVVFGGNVTIAGKIKGDVAGIGGNVIIEDEGVIKGEVIGIGGQIEIDEEAEISGSVTEGPEFNFGEEGFSFEIPSIPPIPTPPDAPEMPKLPETPKIEVKPHAGSSFFGWVGRFIGDGVANIFWAVVLGGLSVLLVLFFPAYMQTVEDTITSAAPVSFVVGIITQVAVMAVITLLSLLFFLILPLCGIPIVALVWVLAMLVGWAVVGKLVGSKIFTAFGNVSASHISTTLLGVSALTLIVTMPFFDQLPGLGWMFGFLGGLVGFLASSVGLGAVVLSRFGTRNYQPSASAALLTAKTAPPQPEAEVIETTEATSPDSTETLDTEDDPDLE